MDLRDEAVDDAGRIISGELVGGAHRYGISAGIPRLVGDLDQGQEQTSEAFGYKWQRRRSYDSAGMRETSKAWLIERYGFESATDMASYFASREAILDLGCGSGYSASLWMDESPRLTCWVGVDISDAIDVARDRLASTGGTHFVQADALRLPFLPESFDTVFSEGVLHHTRSTREALRAAVEVLRPGGEILFYVYRRKGPVREFVDDHIRHKLANLGPSEAWVALEPLTRLGQSLAGLKATIEIPEDIDVLEIPPGRYDVQRLVYWHFAKMFWNDQLSFEENQHVNFDWYSPRYAHRQSEEEVRAWCREAGLGIEAFRTEDSGFTVRAVKNPIRLGEEVDA